MPLGSYIRSRLLNGDGRPRRAYRKPVRDDRMLAELLGELGKARLASNLNQLARAANTGSLPVTEETLKFILTACKDVQQMRTMLMLALGLDPEEQS